MTLTPSLKNAWTLIILVAVITPVTIVMIWYGSTTYELQLSSALKKEQQANELLKNQIESEIKRFKTLLKNKSDPFSFLIEDAHKQETLKQMNELLAFIVNREPAIHEAIILSTKAKVITAVDSEMGILGDKLLSPEELKSVAKRAGFNENYEIPEVVIPSLGRLYIGAPKQHDNTFTFNMAAPIGKTVKAILIIFIDVNQLLPNVAKDEHGIGAEKSQDYILDRRGTLLTEITNSDHNPGDLMTHLAITRAALINETWPTDVSYTGPNNKVVYGTLTTIPSLSWTLISEVTVSAITQPIWDALLKIGLLTLLGIFIFITLILRLVNNTIKPIEETCKAIDQMAKGNYQFTLKSSGIHELNSLTTGFNQMAIARQEAEAVILEREKDLENKEKEQREMLNSIVDAVVSIDENGIILSFNKAAEKIFGYNYNEIIGQKVNLLMPESFSSKHDDYIHNYVKTGEARVIGLGREVEGKRKNGDIFPMRLLIAELPADSSGKQRFIASCVDLTYIQQQETQLRRSQKMDAIGKLSGGIAHDYNNMLGVIMGYSELLENALNEHPKLEKYVQEIHHASKRGAKLTKKLLSFSSKENSGAEMFNLNVILLETQHMLEKTLTARIKLSLDLNNDLWPVWLDEADMEDAIINLSINAMHAIDGNGQLTIKTRNIELNTLEANLLSIKPGDYALLELIDTGCGMDINTKERIFEPFFTTKGTKGTGLGLSQVYGFVKRNNGAIKIHSEIDQGSCFSLYFPRYIAKPIDEKQETTNQSQINIKGNETILLVDDEPALLDLNNEILSKQGYNIICASNAQQALDILATENIQLLFSDVIMPEMNGFQLAKIVQKQYPLVKIQLASGFTDDHQMEISDGSLYKNILHKPYNTHELLIRVRNLLDTNTDSY